MVAKTRSKKSNFDVHRFRTKCNATDGSLFALNAIYKKYASRRVQYIDEMSMVEGHATEIIRMFPDCREHCELILHDYKYRVKAVSGIEVTSIAEQFRRYMPLIFEQAKFYNLEFAGRNLPSGMPSGSTEYKQLVALKLLIRLLARNTPKGGLQKQPISKYSLVVEKPKSLTPHQFVRKIRNTNQIGRRNKWNHSRKAPLIVVIRRKGTIQLRLLVDNQLLKINGDPADALELFFAAHYTFDLTFDRAVQGMIPFLNRVTGLNKNSRLRSGYKQLYEIFEEAL